MRFDITIKDMTLEEVVGLTKTLKNETNFPIQQLMNEEITIHVPDEVSEDEETPVDFNPTETDSEGLVWDARIHSSSRKKKKSDGTWNRRKGISDEEFNAIRISLKGMTIPVAPVTSIAPVATFTEAPKEIEITERTVMTPVTAPVIPAAPAALTIQDLFMKIQQGLMNKTLSQEQIPMLVQNINAVYGTQAASLVDFTQRPDLVKAAYDMLTNMGA